MSKGKEMKTITVNENIITMVAPSEPCPLCGGRIGGDWAMFHGEINSYCCGAPYQTKSYHVSDIDEHKEEFELYEQGYVQLKIHDWLIKPIQDLFNSGEISYLYQITKEHVDKHIPKDK